MKATTFFLLLVALASAACNTPPASAPAQPVAAAPAAPAAPAPGGVVAAAPAAPAVAPAAAPAKPVLATAEGERSGSRLEVRELKRGADDTVMLKLELFNDASDANFDVFGHYLGEDGIQSDYRSVGGIHLVDPANKKKYLVVRDSEQQCQCTRELADIPPSKSVTVWARFPAPPADVTALSVVVPHFSPMDGVPVR